MSFLIGFAFFMVIMFIFSDLFFPFLLIGVFVVVVMSATHMIEWHGNKPDVNIQRGIEWMKQHDENGNWVGPETEADAAAKQRQQRLQDDTVIILE